MKKPLSLLFALCSLLCIGFAGAATTPVAQTVGSNLTAYPGGMGSINNNAWNAMTNPRTGGTATASFGGCDALIQRCATPKCATGGCTTMEITYPIVAGCVMANENCSGHGDALIQSISAQIVANATARANTAANTAAANNAGATAAQNAAATQQMQQQLQQIQQQAAAAAAQQQAQLDAALEQQRKMIEQQQAAQIAAAATQVATTSQQIPTDVSADILARERASGEIMTQLENAEISLKTLESTMRTVFEYAGCDRNGDNCTGPKRVRAYKDKALDFFDPYEDVLDEVYDALVMAQSLGVDITDIYMMLNGTCNVWGKYLCGPDQEMHYNNNNCKDGRSKRSNVQCSIGQVIPMNDGGCQFVQMLNDQEQVYQEWLYYETGNDKYQVRVGCASEALDNSLLFRGRKKQATIDIEVLERIIEQDAPNSFRDAPTDPIGNNPAPMSYCIVDENTLGDLQTAANLRRLPDDVCVDDDYLKKVDVSAAVASVPIAAWSNPTLSPSVQAGLEAAMINASMRIANPLLPAAALGIK